MLIKDEFGEEYEVVPDVMTLEEIKGAVPFLAKHPKLAEKIMHKLQLDRVNKVHGACSTTPGPEFVRRLVYEQFNLTLKIDNEEVLEKFKEGPFITISNHPMGAMDGIVLIYVISSFRPRYKVMVNMILNKLSGMRPNFIAVDALASDDPAKRQVSINGIRRVLQQLKSGEPVGFFPAGAVSKLNWKLRKEDRQWQESVIQIIKKAKVPVIPIYFHDGNSWTFNALGLISWKLRTLRLPREVFNKMGKTIHLSIGEPISAEEQALHSSSIKELGNFLRKRTYDLKKQYKNS